MVTIDAPLGQTHYVYDGISRLTSVTDPAGDLTTYYVNPKLEGFVSGVRAGWQMWGKALSTSA
ncbi:hypothetical protein AL755_03245 (plasmid) [Arthrobacter sp. ERGS1:01]|nr:hypothetical protein AL755_03245 [Arthrobacter sp. ERGS1:01]